MTNWTWLVVIFIQQTLFWLINMICWCMFRMHVNYIHVVFVWIFTYYLRYNDLTTIAPYKLVHVNFTRLFGATRKWYRIVMDFQSFPKMRRMFYNKTIVAHDFDENELMWNIQLWNKVYLVWRAVQLIIWIDHLLIKFHEMWETLFSICYRPGIKGHPIMDIITPNAQLKSISMNYTITRMINSDRLNSKVDRLLYSIKITWFH